MQQVQTVSHTIYQRGDGDVSLTYTNYFKIDSEEVEFLSLPEKEQERIANQILREPLTNFGEVKEKRTA